jgi:metal-sulfur cluster biosynthetic enzyme
VSEPGTLDAESLAAESLAAESLAAQPLAAELRVDEEQVRLAEPDGQMGLGVVLGLDAVAARARLRFGPGRTCEPVARLLDRVIVQAEQAGLSPARLILAAGSVQAGEDIVRVRRKAHGKADWIASPTCRVQITLRPAGLHASGMSGPGAQAPAGPVAGAGAGLVAGVGSAVAGVGSAVAGVGSAAPGYPAPGYPAPGYPAPASQEGTASDHRAEQVRGALLEVIDPDLGVNIVDLGFVRQVEIQDRMAVITMTLTSAACPLTSIMEDQIRAELAGLSDLAGFRVAWEWLPPWRPADMTDAGRDQLRAIGFSF